MKFAILTICVLAVSLYATEIDFESKEVEEDTTTTTMTTSTEDHTTSTLPSTEKPADPLTTGTDSITTSSTPFPTTEKLNLETTTIFATESTKGLEITTEDPTNPNNDDPCVDQINRRTGRSDCEKAWKLCKSKRFSSFMKKSCPRTCGYCPNSECKDLLPVSGTSACAKLKDLCGHPVVGEFIRKGCPETCGVCKKTQNE